jgi:hypothetical protein
VLEVGAAVVGANLVRIDEKLVLISVINQI